MLGFKLFQRCRTIHAFAVSCRRVSLDDEDSRPDAGRYSDVRLEVWLVIMPALKIFLDCGDVCGRAPLAAVAEPRSFVRLFQAKGCRENLPAKRPAIVDGAIPHCSARCR